MKNFLAIFVLPLFLSACLISPGTNTGNPGDDMNASPGGDPAGKSQTLAAWVCTKIKSCYPQSNTTSCLTSVMSLPGYTSELGTAAAGYNTMTDLYTDEADGKITANLTNYETCVSSFYSLSCSDTLIQNAYSNSALTDYSATNLLFRATSACQQIY